MKNFESFQQPAISELPTHITNTITNFKSLSDLPNPNSNIFTDQTLEAGRKLIVIESSYVINNETWCYVKVQNLTSKKYNLTGLIKQENIEKYNINGAPKVKDFITPSILQNYLPDFSSQEIDWRIQKTGIPFRDKKRGLICYLHDTGVDSTSSTGQLKRILLESIIPSLKNILKNAKKESSTEYVQFLFNKYYGFGIAEAFLAPIRGCTTIKALITIPERFVESPEILLPTSEIDSTDADGERDNSSDENLDYDPLDNLSDENQQANYKKIIFTGYKSLETFFDDIATIPDPKVSIAALLDMKNYKLGVLNIVDIVSKIRHWKVDGEELTNLSVDKEIEAVCRFRKKLNNFIFSNIPIENIGTYVDNYMAIFYECNKYLDEDFKTLLNNGFFKASDPVDQKIKKIGFKYFSDVLKYLENRKKLPEGFLFEIGNLASYGLLNYAQNFTFLENIKKLSWNGDLTLFYDKENKELKSFSLRTENKLLSLSRGVLEFLADEDITNKTTLNYIDVYDDNIKNIPTGETDTQETVDSPKQTPATYKEKIDFSGFISNEKNIKSLEYAANTSAPTLAAAKELFSNISLPGTKTPQDLNKIRSGFLAIKDWWNSPSIDMTMFLPPVPNPLDISIKPSDGPEVRIVKFLTESHYPQYSEVMPMPINVFNCIEDNADVLQQIRDKFNLTKLSESFNRLQTSIQQQQKNEGDEWNKFMKGATDVNKHIEILTKGLQISQEAQTDFKRDPWDAINKHVVPVFKELNILQILSDLILCFIKKPNLDPAEINSLLEQYNTVKSWIEQQASATVCNPFTKVELSKIAALEIPELPTYNPNGSILKELENHFAKIIPDLWLKATTEIIKSLMAACVTDNPTNSAEDDNNGLGNDIADSISDPPKDSPLRNMLNNIFPNTSPTSPVTEDADEKPVSPAAQMLENITCTLTLGELCALLRGGFVPESVYSLISSIVNKMKEVEQSKIASSALANPYEISAFFKLIGQQISLEFCEVLDTVPSNAILCGCTPEERLNFINKLSVNLPPEAAQAAIDDLKDKSKDSLKKALELTNGLLTGQTPEDIKKALSDFPTNVCKYDSNGNKLDPVVDLTPSAESFNQLMGNVFNSVYETFNKEAITWNRITYSKTSSVSPMLILDQKEGKLKIKDGNVFENSKNDNMAINYTKIPFYLFKDILDNSSYTINYDKSTKNKFIPGNITNNISLAASSPLAPFQTINTVIGDVTIPNINTPQNETTIKFNIKNSNKLTNSTFYCYVNGDKQEELDVNILQDSLRSSVISAEIKLRKFTNIFMQMLYTYTTIAVAEGISEIGQNVRNNFFPEQDKSFKPPLTKEKKIENQILDFFKKPIVNAPIVGSTLEGALYIIQNLLVSAIQLNNDDVLQFINFLKLLDNFARNTKGNSDSAGYSEDFSKDINGKKALENAVYIADTGVPLYISVSTYMQSQQTKLIQLIKFLGAKLESPSVFQSNDIKVSKSALLLKYLNDHLDEYEKVDKIYSIITNVALEYPSYSFSYYDNYNPEILIATSSLENNESKKYEISKLKIDNNANLLYEIENYNFLDKDISDYINNVLKIEKLNPSKKEVFDAYITRLIGKQVKSAIPVSYESMGEFLFEKTVQSVKNNPFFQIQKVSLQPSGTLEQALTEYVVLKLPDSPTMKQKLCGIYPHYLDIDSLKMEAMEKKKQSKCMDNMLNSKLANNLPYSTDELEKVERNDTQNILLEIAHTLTVRLYAHDIILRGISVFGYYDPQILKDNNLFIDFITTSIESELFAKDALYLRTLYDFTFNKYANLGNIEISESDLESLKKKRFRTFIHDQLKINILPKLQKRLIIDTKKTLNNSQIGDINNNIFYTLNDLINLLKINENVYKQDPYIAINNLPIFNGDVNRNINDTVELKLLFEYLFPIKTYISCVFITNVLCTSTRRKILNTFKSSKDNIREITKLIYSAGQPISPDPNSLQESANAAQSFDFATYILEILLTTPLKIFKGFVETADANVAVVSTSYKLIKTFQPETPDWSQPIAGSLLWLAGIWVPMFLPNPFNILYYAGGFWRDAEDKKKDQEVEDKMKDMFNLSPDCKDVNNPDALKFNSNNYLDIQFYKK